MSKKQKNAIFNPFEGRTPEKVWAEIRGKAKPAVSREEALRTMQALKEKADK